MVLLLLSIICVAILSVAFWIDGSDFRERQQLQTGAFIVLCVMAVLVAPWPVQLALVILLFGVKRSLRVPRPKRRENALHHE